MLVRNQYVLGILCKLCLSKLLLPLIYYVLVFLAKTNPLLKAIFRFCVISEYVILYLETLNKKNKKLQRNFHLTEKNYCHHQLLHNINSKNIPMILVIKRFTTCCHPI